MIATSRSRKPPIRFQAAFVLSVATLGFVPLATGTPDPNCNRDFAPRQAGPSPDGTVAELVENPGANLVIAVSKKSDTAKEEPALAGNQAPPIAPRWAYEPWVWEDNGNTRDSAETLVNEYLQRNIPVGAIIIDSPWSTSYGDYQWNAASYPEPATMIRDFHDKGVKVVLWMTGNINRTSGNVDKGTPGDVPLSKSAAYDEVTEKGYGVGGADFTWWKGVGTHIDVTNPAAGKWLEERLDPLTKMGIDGWKADRGVGEVPDPVQTKAGTMSRLEFMVRYYGWLADYVRERDPAGVILTRPYSHQGGFNTSIEKCLLGWSGDFSGDFKGLKHQLDNLYRSANAGYGPLSVEVGGFQGKSPTKAQLIRYVQFGAMMPGMENGGSNGGLENHLPWWQDEKNGGGKETTDIYRYFATLHSELVPYIFSTGVDSHRRKVPMVRQADIGKAHHLLGDDIFVSVMTEETRKKVRFPEGRWIDWWDSKSMHKGGDEPDLKLPLDRYPIYIRAGAIIPMNVTNAVTGHGDGKSKGAVTVLVFPAGKSRRVCHLPTGDGVESSDVILTMDEASGKFEAKSHLVRDWILRVKSFTKPTSVEGADSWEYDGETKFAIVRGKATDFRVTIAGIKAFGSAE